MPLPEPTMVICIDGPTRGRLRAVTESRFHAYDMTAVTTTKAPDSHELIFDALTYHVHIISFLGFGIRVASMKSNPADIDTYDVICALFNEAGRQATYKNGE